MQQWRDYWTQIQRALDRGAPHGLERPVTPPWAYRVPPPASPAPAAEAGRPPRPDDLPDGWFIESFTALLRLDSEPVEALEHRIIVSTADGLSELVTSVAFPGIRMTPARHTGWPRNSCTAGRSNCASSRTKATSVT